MDVIWHGTASIELKCKEGRILFDPFVPMDHSPVNVDISEFDGINVIFITHGHFDHIYSLPAIVTRNPDILIYCTSTPFHTLLSKGIPASNLRCIDYHTVIHAKGFKITAFHGKHAILPSVSMKRIAYALKSPARKNLLLELRENRRCQENDETIFYNIENEDCSISIMGSLNLREEISYPAGADLLILPYNGWDDNFSPAVKVIERLRPKKVLLDHYDNTFPPITMPLDISPIIKRYPGIVEAMELDITYNL